LGIKSSFSDSNKRATPVYYRSPKANKKEKEGKRKKKVI